MSLEQFNQKIKKYFTLSPKQRLNKREMVILDEGSSVIYIESGYLRVYRLTETGEELTLVILKPGDTFPFLIENTQGSSEYCVEAMTASEIKKSAKDKFFNYLKSDGDLSELYLLHTFQRWQEMLNRMENLVLGTAYNKIATTLFDFAARLGQKRGGAIILDVPLTHKDIASLVGITRETTCLEMKKLKNEGVINYQGRLLVIKDMQKLGNLTGSSNSFFN